MCLLQACIAASCQSPYHDHTQDHDADYDIYFFVIGHDADDADDDHDNDDAGNNHDVDYDGHVCFPKYVNNFQVF